MEFTLSLPNDLNTGICLCNSESFHKAELLGFTRIKLSLISTDWKVDFCGNFTKTMVFTNNNHPVTDQCNATFCEWQIAIDCKLTALCPLNLHMQKNETFHREFSFYRVYPELTKQLLSTQSRNVRNVTVIAWRIETDTRPFNEQRVKLQFNKKFFVKYDGFINLIF